MHNHKAFHWLEWQTSIIQVAMEYCRFYPKFLLFYVAWPLRCHDKIYASLINFRKIVPVTFFKTFMTLFAIISKDQFCQQALFCRKWSLCVYTALCLSCQLEEFKKSSAHLVKCVKCSGGFCSSMPQKYNRVDVLLSLLRHKIKL